METERMIERRPLSAGPRYHADRSRAWPTPPEPRRQEALPAARSAPVGGSL